MRYTRRWLIDSLNKGENFKYIYFWSHQPSKSGEIIASCFSQWWKSTFEVDGIFYLTAEHWMMAQKALLFDDKENFQAVMEARSPGL